MADADESRDLPQEPQPAQPPPRGEESTACKKPDYPQGQQFHSSLNGKTPIRLKQREDFKKITNNHISLAYSL